MSVHTTLVYSPDTAEHPPGIYRSLAGRLASFTRILQDGSRFVWQNPCFVSTSAESLANAGFFAHGNENYVTCAFCGHTRNSFSRDFDAKNHNPQCQFTLKQVFNSEDTPRCDCIP